MTVGLNADIAADIGQTLYAYATNAESVTITKGQPVYMFAAQGDRVSVKLAYNTGDATSAKTLGICAEDIGANQAGMILCQGVQDGLNLGAYTAGDTLYLGATAGTLTNTKPYAPNHLVYIGVVERANNGNGRLYVRVQNGYELDELHNVSAQNPTNGQVLIYNESTSLWTKNTLTDGTGITITEGAGSITIANGGVTSITGTTNEIDVSASTGSVTISLPATISANINGTVGANTPASGSFTSLTSSGQLILNTTGTAYATDAVTPQCQIGGTTQSSSSMSLITSSATTTTDPTIFLAKNKSGTQGTFTTAVVNTDELGAIRFAGSNTSTLATGAEIKGVATGTWTTGSQPTDLVFSTVSGGTTTLKEAMRLTQNQEVLIGADASGVTEVAGYGLTLMSSSGGIFNFYRNDTTVVSGNALGIIDFYSNGSGSILYAATIQAEAGGTFTVSSTPSELVFYTCPSGSTTTAEAVRIKSGGGLLISRTAVTAPATGDGNVFSGTYTPAQVGTNTNVDSVTFVACQYMRVGSVVTVSGQITIDATTATTDTIVRMSIPIASNFANSRELGGVGSSFSSPYASNNIAFVADTTNDCAELRLRPSVNTSLIYNFSFTYRVI
jgi:hypothetical protein